MKKASIIGSGFSSLAAACYLAKDGFEVDVYEKNTAFGGRARKLNHLGFTFDMGPSWYWMPDIFERFFADFGKSPSDYYNLTHLSPAYKTYFPDGSNMEISDSMEKIYDLFEIEEKGSSVQLKKFLSEAETNYKTAMGEVVYRPGKSPLELLTIKNAMNVSRFFSSIHSDLTKRFKSKKLIQLLEFPILFLGAKPENTPAFYSFMNYADLKLGTWYPKGGMYEVVKAMLHLGKELGVTYHLDSPIQKIVVENNKAIGLEVKDEFIESDVILSGADYHHTESLLDKEYRAYTESYWKSKTFAPSALLFYVGIDKKVKNLLHHNLFFDEDFNQHLTEIYDDPSWPESPLFYANFPSISDESLAPEGKESAFFLIPLAPGLPDDKNVHKKYFDLLIKRVEKLTGQSIKDDILFSHSYCIDDFKSDYNAYKGNAYGLANTLSQTAFLRPKLQSKKVENLFFTGQLTVPGPGVPPALISGKLASQLISKKFKRLAYDKVV